MNVLIDYPRIRKPPTFPCRCLSLIHLVSSSRAFAPVIHTANSSKPHFREGG